MPGIYRSMFAINDINNGALKSIHAMPQKDSTSDGTNSFAIDRSAYFNTLPTTNNTVAQNLHKKWFTNRDASSVTRNRRIAEIGVGSMNAANTPMSFTTYKDVNVVKDAVRRVRSAGSVAPAKKNALKTNGLTPSWKVGKLIRTGCNIVPNVQFTPTTPVKGKPTHTDFTRVSECKLVTNVQTKTAMYGKPNNKNVTHVYL
jgi:hypothetical protein